MPVSPAVHVHMEPLGGTRDDKVGGAAWDSNMDAIFGTSTPDIRFFLFVLLIG
ncbi:hypothetical protein GGTG_07119 [Gaeumannomyces tritici R3-111a-1]|uniref:Uncharacterized protein n=1 Tax=Gaeumannomyces tritici (strain R3-111a-1) TaxID=644352 RepID=J3P0S4_GAET3|nr:hypothetical protein GGTG_07119 [Gaeumannomyces tritici R3-111a-1]EJT77207.1 hypothetical protein GGTG_07119 [Gaeumannomyces tritici R3-111a-1]